MNKIIEIFSSNKKKTPQKNRVSIELEGYLVLRLNFDDSAPRRDLLIPSNGKIASVDSLVRCMHPSYTITKRSQVIKNERDLKEELEILPGHKIRTFVREEMEYASQYERHKNVSILPVLIYDLERIREEAGEESEESEEK